MQGKCFQRLAAAWCKSVLFAFILMTLSACSGDPDPADSDVNNTVAPANNKIPSDNNDVPENNITPNNDTQVEEGSNDCGGGGALLFEGSPAKPGDACGVCGDGELECDGENALTCLGTSALNVCGGCGELDGEPGGACGENGLFYCTPDGELTCREAPAPEALFGEPAQQEMTPEEVEEFFEVGTNSAVFKAEFEDIPEDVAVSDHGFCWGEQPGPTPENSECKSLGPLTSAGAFNFKVEDLFPGRKYYVRAYAVVFFPNALVDGATVFSQEVNLTTKPADPENPGVGEEPHADYVALYWNVIEGATAYVIYRDGEEIARVSGDLASYQDYGATAGSVPSTPDGLFAQGFHDRVSLSWSAAYAQEGPVHSYQLQVEYPESSSVLSEAVDGYRKAAEIDAYEISIDGGSWISVGASQSYDHTTAPAPEVHTPTVSASEGTSAAHVVLTVTTAPSLSSTSVSYRVRAVNAEGASPGSGSVTASRSAGSLNYQWQRSASDSASDFSAINGANTATYYDTDAPADGSARYYRMQVSAQGAESVYSNAVAGFRAALGAVETLAATEVSKNQANLHGVLTLLGVPDTTAHGFCYGLGEEPALSGEGTCIDLGGTSTTGNFQTTASGLEAGTQYFVRAFVTSNAGTSYGASQTFWTVAEAPQVSTSSGASQVTVSWSAVAGATSYVVTRDGAQIAVVDHTTLSFGDADASPASPPGSITITSVSEGTRTDGVLVQWNAASASPGA